MMAAGLMLLMVVAQTLKLVVVMRVKESGWKNQMMRVKKRMKMKRMF